MADVRKPTDVVNFETARKAHRSEFVPWEVIENDIVLHDIFKLAESDTHTEDKKLDADADEIGLRLHQVQKNFSQFAIGFIMNYTRQIYLPDELAARTGGGGS